MTTPNQPQKSDAVLGGNSPAQAAVMGGIQGIKIALVHAQAFPQQQELLRSALQYGQEGIAIIMQYLCHSDKNLRNFAYELLRERQESHVKQALALFTASGIYYRDLQQLLRRQQWEAANFWTQQTVGELCHAPQRVTKSHILNLPCGDLLLIDRLWREASHDRFGFTVQARIWQQCTQLLWDQNRALSLFGDRVGWRVHNLLFNTYHWKRYEELNFSLRAPRGHLPWINGIFLVKAINDRLLACQGKA
ncbi:MAG: GUN4 domain-containing protein [Pseudanabaenaceae cyanobacterium SKYGB_i_bin29]|nr:GUN4 domain-containing protein [Pseudanabaenaceae cyanobacterium SKYG29]MDW8421980.1 GUN4 domain-containing protein [Pseudanabaenaceae cyanobacterium SKYGB_i_bin29]